MDPALALEIKAESRIRAIHATLQSGESRVIQMYAGTAVLVTGGSGCLGKQLIEKLLRTCDVKKIYVLLRPKKNKTVEQRLSKLLSEPLFESVQKTRPEYRSLVVAVPGDVSELRAGIRDEDRDTLTAELHVIFHGAATINFASPLREAVYTNVRGTREMLALAKECKKLKSFVYISTALSHATKSRINDEVLEKFYKSPLPPHTLVELAENTDNDTLEGITQQLINDWPNTYTYTKAVAEELVRLTTDIRCCVVRPSLISSAYMEPMPGWIDETSVYGPNGLWIGSAVGVIRVVNADRDNSNYIVPVDFVNNASLVAGLVTSEKTLGDETKIYTISNCRNYITWGQMLQIVEDNVRPYYPTSKMIWYPFLLVIRNPLLYSLAFFLLHTIPGYLIDTICWMINKPQQISKIYSQLAKLSQVCFYFAANTWQLKDDNAVALYSTMSTEDQILFNFDVATIDWTEYIMKVIVGNRIHVMKDGLETVEYAKKKLFWLKLLHYVFVALYVYCLLKLFSFVFSTTYDILGF